MGVTFPDDLRFSLSNSAGQGRLSHRGRDLDPGVRQDEGRGKAAALKDWLTWALTDGAAIAEDLGYAALPQDLKDMALAKVDLIK